MNKAKKFQPLAVLNQKFRGLDVFESNDAPPLPAPKISSGTSTPEPPKPVDPDELVTRTHWQRPSYNDACSDPMCGKRLGGANGSVNCRKCGKLFCEEHTMYQMKLSRSAQHEPVRGIWCRVCETCYKSREGYNDHKGVELDHTSEFSAIRRRTVDRNYLEVSRLEKRLSKLTQLLANPPPPQESNRNSFIWPLGGGAKAQERELEQTVVDWQDDASILKCPFCQQEFSTYSFRRHHCRTCGRVVCGDPKTKCSTLVGLNVASPTTDSEKSQNQIGLDVRICKDCRHTLFSKADFDRELQQKPSDQRTYENLAQFERGIRLLLPKFQRLLQALQYVLIYPSKSITQLLTTSRDPENPPTPTKIAEASKVRKRLTDSFIQYESAARRIRDLPTQSPTQARLQKAVYQQASNFLHLHMLPLKSLPKVLKHASPHGAPNGKAPNGRSNGALSAIRFNDAETASQVSSSSALESMEAEEKDLRERLIVLEEQKFIVSEMVADARKKRRFDEERSLSQNVEDLSREIDSINGQLGTLKEGFRDVYERMGSPAQTPAA